MLAHPVTSQHGVVETAQTRYLRRVLRDPHLCTIYSFVTGNWIIGRWIDHAHGTFMELGLLEPPFTEEKFHCEVIRINKRYSAETLEFLHEMKQSARLAERHDLVAQQDAYDEETQQIEFIRKNCHLTHRDDPGWLLV